MKRRAEVTQEEVARIVRAAKQAGAAEVEVRIGQAVVTVRMSSTGQASSTADNSEVIPL